MGERINLEIRSRGCGYCPVGLVMRLMLWSRGGVERWCDWSRCVLVPVAQVEEHHCRKLRILVQVRVGAVVPPLFHFCKCLAFLFFQCTMDGKSCYWRAIACSCCIHNSTMFYQKAVRKLHPNIYEHNPDCVYVCHYAKEVSNTSASTACTTIIARWSKTFCYNSGKCHVHQLITVIWVQTLGMKN